MNTSYVAITPAFNEEKYIYYALESMARQTIKPTFWVIVDDGSKDSTSKIIKDFENKYNWIKYYYNNKRNGETYYSSNVFAILEGIKLVQKISYSYLAILDADIELCNDYYERIFEKFSKYKDLGIASGTYMERVGTDWEKKRTDPRHTPKAIQVFRKECYESTNGYIPFKYGGEDSGIEVMARMQGWKTWSFDEIVVKHHRPVGTGDGCSLLYARFRQGMTDYCLGTHPCFMFFKSIKRMFSEKPHGISGIARLLGYLNGYFKKLDKQLPAIAIDSLRKDQMRRVFRPYSQQWKLE